jgi:hypothetical protein
MKVLVAQECNYRSIGDAVTSSDESGLKGVATLTEIAEGRRGNVAVVQEDKTKKSSYRGTHC